MSDDFKLLTSRQVRNLLGGCSAMALWRYTNDPRYSDLNFPRPIQIGSRNFWRTSELARWIEERAARAGVKRKRPGRAGGAAA